MSQLRQLGFYFDRHECVVDNSGKGPETGKKLLEEISPKKKTFPRFGTFRVSADFNVRLNFQFSETNQKVVAV